MNTVFQTGGPNTYNAATTDQLITVLQREGEAKLLTIVYGLQINAGLTYSQCCTALGAAILHRQCCEGLVSNEGF